MPEKQDAVWFAPHEAGAIHHVGHAVEHRAEQSRVFARVVFVVGILHKHISTGGGHDALPDDKAFATVGVGADQADGETRIAEYKALHLLDGLVF